MMGENYFVLGQLAQPRLNKNLLYRHDKPNEPTKEGPLLIVLFESPFTSVSTVSRGHPSLVSLDIHMRLKFSIVPLKVPVLLPLIPAPFINIFLFNQKVKSVKVFQGNLI
jgi:hypothetical protein